MPPPESTWWSASREILRSAQDDSGIDVAIGGLVVPTRHCGATLATMPSTRVLLIGGPSHAGKSTLAELLAERLGWAHVSTDWLARHPGRPWPADGRPVPDHVVEHYGSQSVDELVADVLRHYNSMWPLIEGIIRTHVSDEAADCLVFEGSALLPDRFALADLEDVTACWITAGDDELADRIHASADYESLASAERSLVDKFADRNRGLNEHMTEAANRHRLPILTADRDTDPSGLVSRCLGLIDG